jgi:cephalosporin hydroxylase
VIHAYDSSAARLTRNPMKTWKILRERITHELKTIRGTVNRRLAHSSGQEADIVNQFHRLYYEAAPHLTWQNTFWMGHRVLKCPNDLWQYQEILHEVRPDLIIETGTCFGGSALYMAHLCDTLGQGRIITVDLEPREGRPVHPRIMYLTGSSVDPAIVSQLTAAARDATRVMVILDSDHSKDHVSAELRALANLVTPGSYLIVEDTNVNGHPVDLAHGPGPMEALDAFIAERRDFTIDSRGEKFFLTFNPRGYLKRLPA